MKNPLLLGLFIGSLLQGHAWGGLTEQCNNLCNDWGNFCVFLVRFIAGHRGGDLSYPSVVPKTILSWENGLLTITGGMAQPLFEESPEGKKLTAFLDLDDELKKYFEIVQKSGREEGPWVEDMKALWEEALNIDKALIKFVQQEPYELASPRRLPPSLTDNQMTKEPEVDLHYLKVAMGEIDRLMPLFAAYEKEFYKNYNELGRSQFKSLMEGEEDGMTE